MVEVLDAIELTAYAVRLRERSYDLLELQRGDAVVDVGCGTGRAVAELAERGFGAVGVDDNEEMINLARSRFPNAGFRLADALSIPMEEGAVRGYRADKLLHVFGDPAPALAEAHRILAPEGRIVLIGQDWDHLVIDADDIGVTRAIMHARADTIASPWAGRRYRASLIEAGFEDVRIEVHSDIITDHAFLAPLLPGFADAAVEAGGIDRAQGDAWVADLERRGKNDRFMAVIPMFVAAAVRP